MISTGGNAANAQTDKSSGDYIHDLRLTALLFDLGEAQGCVKAAETLVVSCIALARAADTGRLTGRMRDALSRHLLEGTPDLDEKHRGQLADLERRVDELEEGAGDSPEGDDAQVIKLRQELAKIGEELERHGRRIAALESRGPTLPSASVPVVEHPTPSRPAYELVVSLHPDDPGDDEKGFGAAAPLVEEWRRLRDEYGAAPVGLAKLRAEEDLLEMEMLLISGCGLTLPPADYPWDRFDLEDQTRRRRRRMAVVREEIRRAERRRRLRRVFTLGLWRS